MTKMTFGSIRVFRTSIRIRFDFFSTIFYTFDSIRFFFDYFVYVRFDLILLSRIELSRIIRQFDSISVSDTQEVVVHAELDNEISSKLDMF